MKKDPEEDPAYYSADRGNNDDNESSNDNDDDDNVEKDEENKEEEEHLALADPFDVSTDDRHGEKKHYGGSKPLCSKCDYHHDGPCAPKCHKCNRFSHLARDCRSSTNANTSNIQKGTGASQKATCYGCGNQGHYRRD
nr:hypothetical protein [Tanacetum cinerariifolium]GFB60220.1 hypothetical protein [Tanacetum cinerariifolium]